jgi:acetyltransferase-like isoleucine patch superfamily enzyme
MKVFEALQKGDSYDIRDLDRQSAWLGARVSVLPGVTIGENAIIGTGSVVTKDIPENCIAVGNPARVIKTIG